MDLASKLSVRIRIERKTITRDPQYGTEEVSWTEFARVWAEALRVPRVAPDDDFLSLGGDSLLAVQLVAVVSQQVDDHRAAAGPEHPAQLGDAVVDSALAPLRSRARASAKRRAASVGGTGTGASDIDIPAFLRKQAD